MGLKKTLYVRVKVIEHQTVQTYQSWNNVHRHNFDFESVVSFDHLFEKLFSQTLWIVNQMQCREVKLWSFGFLLFRFLEKFLIIKILEPQSLSKIYWIKTSDLPQKLV